LPETTVIEVTYMALRLLLFTQLLFLNVILSE